MIRGFFWGGRGRGEKRGKKGGEDSVLQGGCALCTLPTKSLRKRVPKSRN